jgi:hypothetical protein
LIKPPSSSTYLCPFFPRDRQLSNNDGIGQSQQQQFNSAVCRPISAECALLSTLRMMCEWKRKNVINAASALPNASKPADVAGCGVAADESAFVARALVDLFFNIFVNT